MNLSPMQKRYIWLAGSFPDLAVVQGRGYRRPVTMFNVNRDAGQLTIFGYGMPLFFLIGKGLFRKLQAPNAHTLTEAGEAEFRRLAAAGGVCSTEFKEVELKDRRSSVNPTIRLARRFADYHEGDEEHY